MRVLNDRGYEIFFDEYIPEGVNKIVVALHGFSSSRKSSCILMLKDKLYEYKIGVMAVHRISRAKLLNWSGKMLNLCEEIVL